MGNLKGWRRQEGTSRLQLSTVLSVTIEDCPNLKGKMPLFEGIENFSLWSVDAEVVEELLVPNSSSQSSFSPFHNNSKLKKLEVMCIKGLTQFPEGWIRHLTTLQDLVIFQCWDLKRVSRRGLTHLTALKCLIVNPGEIGDEDEKMGSETGMPWKALQGLEELMIEVGDMNLVEGLQYLTPLRSLSIFKWKDVLIGEGEMKGLELPMKGMQNLQYLRIPNCSAELERRCERGTGEDWPLIRHVNGIEITMARSLRTYETRNEEEEGSRKKGGCTPAGVPL